MNSPKTQAILKLDKTIKIMNKYRHQLKQIDDSTVAGQAQVAATVMALSKELSA